MELLRSADPEDRRQRVLTLCSADVDLPYDREALSAALDPLRSIPDEHLRSLVGRAYCRLRLPGWPLLIRTQLRDPSLKVRTRAMSLLSLMRENEEESLRAVEAMLKSGDGNPYPQILAVASMAGPDSPVRTAAAKVLMDHVRARLAETDHSTGNDIMNAVRAIGPSAHPEAAAILREVIASGQHGSYRAVALRELARSEGRRALEDLGRALRDEQLEVTASEEIGYLGRNSGDPDLVRMLAKVVGTSKRPAAMVRALCFIGGDAARSIIREFIPMTAWWDRLEAEWCLRSLSPREAVFRLIDLGVLKEWPETATGTGLLEPDPLGNPPGAQAILIRAFKGARQYLSFDLELGTVPVGHDGLIRRFSEMSGGVFVPEAVVQTWEPTAENSTPDYKVEFLWRGRLHRFTATYRGDCFDAETVVGALNRALRLADRPERYVRLFAGYDQHVEYVFADARALLAARRALWLPLHVEFDHPGLTDDQIEERLAKELEL